MSQGGRLLASGTSGLRTDDSGFGVDFGARWLGANTYRPDYWVPDAQVAIGSVQSTASSFIMYGEGQLIEEAGGSVLGYRENPYFNRDVFHFCSHKHTPTSKQRGGPGMIEGAAGIYIAWELFEDYATIGSLFLREVVTAALNRLLGERKTLTTSLPAQGVTTIQEQPAEGRLIHHLLYASPVRRGQSIEIIEDIVPLYNITATVRIERPVRSVYLAPSLDVVPFETNGSTVTYTVPKLECHQMVVLELA